MTQGAILEGFKQLPLKEQLEVLASAVDILRAEVGKTEEDNKIENQWRLSKAAQALAPDYAEDEDLTAFTTLDGEDFSAQR